MILALAVAAAGAAGAVCRFLVDGALRRALRTGYPVGTLLINVTGSLLLGLLAGLAAGGWLPDTWLDVAGAGFLGGYTTFSSAAVETVRLAWDGRMRSAALASVGMLLLSTGAAAAGLAAGTGLAGG